MTAITSSLTEQIDTETPTGRLMFNLLGTIAEYFLALNRERTMEGLKAALARGRKGGRPRLLKDGDLAVARAMLNDAAIPIASGRGGMSAQRQGPVCLR